MSASVQHTEDETHKTKPITLLIHSIPVSKFGGFVCSSPSLNCERLQADVVRVRLLRCEQKRNVSCRRALISRASVSHAQRTGRVLLPRRTKKVYKTNNFNVENATVPTDKHGMPCANAAHPSQFPS